jgi:hypothetical protein
MSPPGGPKARETIPTEVMVAPAARKSRRRVLTPSFYGSQNLFSNAQASLRRAVSTAYYALFHLPIDEAVGNWGVPRQRSRTFDHGKMKGIPEYQIRSFYGRATSFRRSPKERGVYLRSAS